MRRSLIFLAAAVATAVTATRTDALVFGLDDRVFIASDPHSPFGAVGIIFGMPEAGYATAFLVDECHALTVQHAFGAAKTAVGRKAVFAAGVKGSSKNWRISSATVVAEGGLQLDPAPNDLFSQRKADWALLKLDKCLGRTFGFVKLSSKLPTEGEEIGVAGYPVDRSLSEGLVVDPSCFIRGTRSGVLLHDCSTMPGNSGSPLFRIVAEHGKNRLEVFAMNTAGHAYGVPGADLVLPVREYLPNYAGVAAPLTAQLVD
jgi:V8-like Glu-specific endopeptidase